ncbi:MAG: glycoside hydrolase family 2 protein, partial [Pseudomonadota bacterium]
MLDLAGLWHLSDETGQYTAPMTLPGDGISALRDAGMIPDPYWGQNETGLRWIAERDWLLTRTFRVTGRDMVLVLSMLDTIVDVSLNGQTVLRANSMFRAYRVDVSEMLVLGENVITLHFRSAPREALRRAEAQPFPVPYQVENCPIPHGNMLRKPECDFGWDWNIALAPFGLYGDIRLEAAGPRIANILVEQTHVAQGVQVRVTAMTEAVQDGTPAQFVLCGVEAQASIRGETASAVLYIDEPSLWWPSGQGAQPLHDLMVLVGDIKKTLRIGLRDIVLVTAPDETGAGFALHINGRPVFMKGANWIPGDALG